MDDDTRDELVKTSLLLTAETRALRLILGFVLAESPQAFERLQKSAKHLDDLTQQFELSDAQQLHLKEVIEQVLERVRTDPFRRRP